VNSGEARIDRQREQVKRACVGLRVSIPALGLPNGFGLYSGFVVEVENEWLFITAEHAFTRTDETAGLNTALARYPSASIAFQPLGLDPKRAAGNVVPFRLDECRRFATSRLATERQADLEPAELAAMRAADCECILLKDLYVDNLRSVGVCPLTWESVPSLSDREASKAVDAPGDRAIEVCGVPSSLTTVEAETAGLWFYCLPLKLESVDNPPILELSRLWGEPDIDDIKGMSGGPVVYLGADQPYLVGIQIAQIKREGGYVYRAAMSVPFMESIRFWIQMGAENLPSGE